jgi:uncharacterized protein YlbG (UPF0298 family)
MKQQKTFGKLSFNETKIKRILYYCGSRVAELDKKTGEISTYYLLKSVSVQDFWQKYVTEAKNDKTISANELQAELDFITDFCFGK